MTIPPPPPIAQTKHIFNQSSTINRDKDHVHFQVKPLPEDRARCVISPADASVKCKNVGVDGLLSRLNALFGTSVDKSHAGVEQTLNYFIDGDHDVGIAYGYLRRTWFLDGSLWDHFSGCRTKGEEWEKQRQDSIMGDFIHHPRSTKPRRVWDLYAHRVIPFEFSKIDLTLMAYYDKNDGYLPTYDKMPNIPESRRVFNGVGLPSFHPSDIPGYFLGVSHSWVKGMSESAIETDVNAREWPIPLPPSVTLEGLRHELLHLVPSGYVWIDVLCLRQATPGDESREARRKKEWGIDVPTMGNIYRPCPGVVRYFNGLGVRFSRTGWNGDRHWSQRAWTLQERNVSSNYIDAGNPDGLALLSVTSTDSEGLSMSNHLGNTSLYRVALPGPYVSFYEVIRLMVRRYSTNPVDKIAGIGMIMGCDTFPVYYEDISLEEAWARFVRCIPSKYLKDYLLGFPYRGEDEKYTWRPTWAQLASFVQEPDKALPFLVSFADAKVEEDGHLVIHMDVIERCRISEPWPTSAGPVSFDKTIPGAGVIRMTVQKAESSKVLEVGTYTLVGEAPRWVVCRESTTTVPERLEKVMAIEIKDDPALADLSTKKDVSIY